MFLEQLIRTLQIEQTDHPADGRKISGPANGTATLSEVSITALLSLGFTVDEVVNDFGDLCQAITDLAFERNIPFEVDEFRTLNRCLDNAIADAVTEFSYQLDRDIAVKEAANANKKLGFLVHELRNFLNTATLSFYAAKAGDLSLSGATGSVLERSLKGLAEILKQSLETVRTEQNNAVRVFSLAEFMEELRLSGELTAKAFSCELKVTEVSPLVALAGNRRLLFSAVWNLVQNAFKFTLPHTAVTLNAYVAGPRTIIEVHDHCGGLPEDGVEHIFHPFTQLGGNKTGLGLGLSIAKRYIEDDGGSLSVIDVPGKGCVFTVNLPRHEVEL